MTNVESNNHTTWSGSTGTQLATCGDVPYSPRVTPSPADDRALYARPAFIAAPGARMRHSASFRMHLFGWLALPVLAAANGALRDATYGRMLESTVAHSVAVLPLVAVILIWATWLAKRAPLDDQRTAWSVGAVWMVATIAAELALGALQGMSVADALVQYDVSRGNLWVLVPLAVLVAPATARSVTTGVAGVAAERR
jgi:hypothetical protein